MRTAGIAESLGVMPAETEEQASAKAAAQVVDLEERGWLPRHVRGDAAAFPALLAAYRRPIYAYLVRAGIAAAERDDLFQAIFLSVHRAAASYQPARALKPWLFTVAANAVRNHFRDCRSRRAVHSDQALPEVDDGQPDPARQLEGRETLAWLAAAIAGLPEKEREVLLLVAVADLAQQEAAEALSLPLNTVKTHLRRARLRLAEALLRRDGGADPRGGPR
jgi:RNA polymerase sigma-70 factor (ECF subfamily)